MKGNKILTTHSQGLPAVLIKSRSKVLGPFRSLFAGVDDVGSGYLSQTQG